MIGSVKVKPNLKTFTEDGVLFLDGTFEELDAVILATGYSYQFKFVEDSVLKIDRNDASLYKYTFPPYLKHPTLAVVGLVQAIGAVMPIAEMQCRWFTRVIKGRPTYDSHLIYCIHADFPPEIRHSTTPAPLQEQSLTSDALPQVGLDVIIMRELGYYVVRLHHHDRFVEDLQDWVKPLIRMNHQNSN
jgi:hypothetical protein